jgi:transposase
LLQKLIPPAKSGGRPRSVDMRSVVNAIFYVLVAGCAWSLLPHDFPKWKTVYHYFRQWRINGAWEQIHEQLRQWVGVIEDHHPSPSAAASLPEREGAKLLFDQLDRLKERFKQICIAPKKNTIDSFI